MDAERSRATIHQVAEQAGVSVGTVSNVLNHPEKVSAHTLDEVRAAITALHFTPNETARRLRLQGRTPTVEESP